MTEKEFQKQIWRMFDQITIADGVKGKVLGVNFTTRSVRAYISGAPEWVKCDLIETHITGKGGDADDDAIIEELHHRVINQTDEIERLKSEKKELEEKISGNLLSNLLRAVNMVKQGLTEKKTKIAKIDDGLAELELALNKIEKSYGCGT